MKNFKIKTCTRKHPITYTVIKVPDKIDNDFIEWVNNKVSDISLTLEYDPANSAVCYVDSNVEHDYWEDIYPNEYIVINNYSGKFTIYKDKKTLWEQYEEISN